ncbi:hypothetical protein [Luteolibacter luteus]|uniref:Uncharacterized protein n=1 Tax=Luteolibacter luteus TaxID=2728835 RepID=A0A858RIU5_9BACT|nr:hypothetical protein [Luteolibacter luteus]QJE96501.1 hypothetical protein HHL09_12150 [Luteolibacter luteus]
MKPIIPFALLGALLVGAAQAASTTPVGYLTVDIAANGDTYISPSLVEATVFASASSASPSGGSTITFSGSVPTGLDTTYVLEITSGTSEGWWSTVTSSTATSITVNDAFPAGLPANTQVSVRKHSTLKTFLGLNAPGLIPFTGTGNADQVQVLNPVTQSVTIYSWVTAEDWGAAEGVWMKTSDSSDGSNTIIEPGSAVKIKRFGGALSFVATGTVKVTKTQVDIFPNFNWVGTPAAAGSTLNGLQFNTQLTEYTGESANYDELQILRPAQNVDTYVAADFAPLTMMKFSDSSNAGTEPFKEGTGAVVRRLGATPASTITYPATVVGQ